MISHGVDRLARFPQDEPNRRRVAARKRQGNCRRSCWRSSRNWRLQDGNLTAAVEAIQTAYERDSIASYESILLDLTCSCRRGRF